MSKKDDKEALIEENRRLRTRMEELDAIRRAIRSGEVDALVVSGHEDEHLLMLEDAMEPYRVMVETMSEGAVSLAVDGTILYANNYFVELIRITREKIIGFQLRDIVAEEDRDKFDAMVRRGVKENTRGKLALLKNDGTHLPALFSMSPLAESAGKVTAAVVTDLSEITAAEEARYRLALIVESSDDAIVSTTPDGVVESWNTAAETLFGYSAQEAIGHDILSLIVPPGREDETKEKLDTICRGERIKHFETVRQHRNTTQFPVSVTASPIVGTGGKIAGASLIFRDITERKKDEESIRRANRALRTLSASDKTLVRVKNEEELLQATVRSIVEIGGYRLAWVSFYDKGANNPLVPVAHFGNEISYQHCINLIPDPKHALHCITFSALREHKTKVCNDIQKTPECDCAALREVGVAAILVLPLFYNNNIRGLLTIISSSSNALDDEEIRLLEELANNLAYGISSLRTRAEHKQHTLLLRQSLEQSIQAIASTLEARDPYTAGHQRRVAELSVAIATEMGLSPDGIEGIRFAAMIHDLGKIHIPAEILSKPGELSDIEYMLIQTHPQEGNNILKEITFPWPIADIILQHHERLDGSGYPRELRGDQILPEAKIICVADVVEAMSSHRPYRPGMGIEAALEEIRRGRGSIYDPDVVDACLKLFDEKGFAFNSVSRTP